MWVALHAYVKWQFLETCLLACRVVTHWERRNKILKLWEGGPFVKEYCFYKEICKMVWRESLSYKESTRLGDFWKRQEAQILGTDLSDCWIQVEPHYWALTRDRGLLASISLQNWDLSLYKVTNILRCSGLEHPELCVALDLASQSKEGILI